MRKEFTHFAQKAAATVARVQTMADGGLRFVFDAPETETLQAAELMECKRWGVVGQLIFDPIELDKSEAQEQNETRTIIRTKAKRRKPKSGTSV